MEKYLYFRNPVALERFADAVLENIQGIVCGDYGCPKVLPAVDLLMKAHGFLGERNKGLHYISPKASLAMIDEEEQRVLAFLREGISVSFNDWGLLFRIRNQIKPEFDIYIGRLLTKSIADWAFSPLFFKKEDQKAVDWLSQNSFHHQPKLEYFRNWGIKGVEVNCRIESEIGYQKIKDWGYQVMGYVDHPILAVSRACPTLRYHHDYSGPCQPLCMEKMRIYPENIEQQSIYPHMELLGNIIYAKQTTEPVWQGYEKLIYSRINVI